MNKCRICGKDYKEDEIVCSECGAIAEKDMTKNTFIGHNWFEKWRLITDSIYGYSKNSEITSLEQLDSCKNFEDIYSNKFLYFFNCLVYQEILSDEEQDFVLDKIKNGDHKEKELATKILDNSMLWLTIYYWLTCDTNIPFSLFKDAVIKGINIVACKCDTKREGNFYTSSYVDFYIKYSISQIIRQQEKDFNMPPYYLELYNDIRRAMKEFHDKTQSWPSYDTVAKMVGKFHMDEKMVDKIIKKCAISHFDDIDRYYVNYLNENSKFKNPMDSVDELDSDYYESIPIYSDEGELEDFMDSLRNDCEIPPVPQYNLAKLRSRCIVFLIDYIHYRDGEGFYDPKFLNFGF